MKGDLKEPKKLCIFPSDPIMDYYKKGEIKARYFNPQNTFDEIHMISFTEKDVEENKVKELAGNAKLKIYSVGKITNKNRPKKFDEVLEIVKMINPQVIRAYNSRLQGWFAAKCSKELKIPFFVSLHTQYDHLRKLTKKKSLKKFLGLKYTEKFIEPFVLKNANKITIVYKIIESYVNKHTDVKAEILPNRIDYERFTKGTTIKSLTKPLIISVGRLIEPKNHQCLIEAMVKIDAHLLIVGDGHLYNDLTEKIKTLKLENKVTILRSIPNNKIQDYYQSADIFTLAYDTKLEGLPIPIMEAMAAGLPIIIPHIPEGTMEDFSETLCFSDKNPASFAKNINNILKDSKLREKLSANASEKAKQFDSSVIEKREAEIYLELLSLPKTFNKEYPNS